MSSALFILIGLAIGSVAAWLIAKFKFKSEKTISQDELDNKYVLKELYAKQEADLKNSQVESKEKEVAVLNLSRELSAKEEYVKHLNEKLETSKKEMESLQEKFKLEFENIANRLLDEKSGKFTELNKTNMDTILAPLNAKIEEFKRKVEETYTGEVRDITALKTEIKQLVELNQQVSGDANRLANAIKGESKTQGDWGEAQLELILERSGLIKNTQYRKQATFDTEEGQKRPDYIINLPEERNLIIDSKVSLVAYTNYFNADNENDRKRYLAENLVSFTAHIKDLNSKNYPSLYSLNPPDYVFMFIPIEPALTLVIKEDPGIINFALDKNIVLITGSTLLATLRTVSYVWKQEDRKRNVLEIARQSGALYDKFVEFINDLISVGKKIDDAKDSHHSAMNKLFESKKKGDTLIGRIEKIKELGAKATKDMPEEVVDRLKLEES